MEENKTNTKISISSLKKNFDDNKGPSKVPLKDKEDEVLSPLNNTVVTEEEALAEKEALQVERKVKIKPIVSISKDTETLSVETPTVTNETVEAPLPPPSNKKIWISSMKKQMAEAAVSEVQTEPVSIVSSENEIEKVENALIETTPIETSDEIEKNTEAPVETSLETEKTESTSTEIVENTEKTEAPLAAVSPIPEAWSGEIFTNYTPYFDKRKDFLLKKVEQIKTKVKTNWKFIAVTIVIWIMVWASMIFIDPSQHSFNSYKSSIIDAGHKIKDWEKIFSFPWEVEIKTIDVPDIIVDTVVEEPVIVEPIVEEPLIEDITPIVDEVTSSRTTVETNENPVIKQQEEILKEVTKEIIKDYFKNIQFQE